MENMFLVETFKFTKIIILDIANNHFGEVSHALSIIRKFSTLNYPKELEIARKALSRYQNFQLAGRTGLFWYNNMDHSMENAMQLVRQMLKSSGKTNITESKLASGM